MAELWRRRRSRGRGGGVIPNPTRMTTPPSCLPRLLSMTVTTTRAGMTMTFTRTRERAAT